MENPRWMALDELAKMDNLYEPFRHSLVMFVDYLLGDLARHDGGAGSGNWGHAGVKGKRGGSAKRNGKKQSLKISPKERVKVTHEINNVYHTKYKGKRRGMISTYYKDKPYYYTFDIYDFDNYNIFRKTPNKD